MDLYKKTAMKKFLILMQEESWPSGLQGTIQMYAAAVDERV